MSDQPSFMFDEAVALEQTGPGRYRREQLDQRWGSDVFNGGYIHCLTAQAAICASERHSDPVAITTTFGRPVVAQPADLIVSTLNAGRNFSSLQVDLQQDGVGNVTSLVTMGELPTELDAYDYHPMPEVPGPEACEVAGKRRSGIREVVELRAIPGHDGWITREYSHGPTVMSWMRFADGRPIDPLAAIGFSDMMPPVAFAIGNAGWSPTLQLMVGLFAKPQGEFLLLHAYGSPYGDTGIACEDVDIWDQTGRLVARARQVALPPRRPSHEGERSGH